MSARPPKYHRTAGVSPAVTEQTIRAVVDDFYDHVRRHEALGPVFAAHIDDWSKHLPKMYAFWVTVLLGEQRYVGNPIEVHKAVTGLSGELFVQWLDLFDSVLVRHCTPEDAAAWRATARRMGFAMSYRLGFGQNEALLP